MLPDSTSSSPSGPIEDNIPPTVAISTDESLRIDMLGTITFTFSEEVKGFTKDDVKLSSSDFFPNDITIGSFNTNNPKKYSLNITPKLAGTLTVTVQAKSFYDLLGNHDLSGNQNTNSFSNNFLVEDKTSPIVTSINTAILIEEETAYLSIVFSENINNFTPDDIQFLSTGVNNVEKGKFLTNNQKSYSLQITPKETGSLEVSIPAKSFEDLSGNQNNEAYSDSFTIHPSGTTTHIISFKPLNGGSFISPQITNLKVVDNTAIEQTQLEKILSYPPTGPKPNINAVTRDVFEWRNNGTTYDLSTPVNSDLILEAVWSNSCGQVETIHPTNRTQLVDYLNLFIPTYYDGHPPPYATNLNHVDVSAIADMSRVFIGKKSFNGNMYCWNTANVKNMTGMFHAAYAFNQDINSWNVGNVKNMALMFQNANAFNQDISTWNVANVKNMARMFWSASKFNQPIGSWDLGNVTNMASMLSYAHHFNQDISRWNVANVNNMNNMFYYASAFNQNIGSWDVSKVNNMQSMFHNARAFNQDISRWNVANVNNMNNMFSYAKAFNQDISTWNVANVTDMNSMFQNAYAFNQDISTWNVANVNNMNSMFQNAYAFNQDISRWNVANVNNMSYMFNNAKAFDQDLSGWDVDKVTRYSDIFTRSAMEEKNKPAKFRTSFTISFNLNGGMFPSPQTNLIVSRGSSISQATLDKIQANYPDVGPKEGVTGVSREFVEWRVGGAKYNSSPITSDMTLGAVWSNSCRKIETIHPANRNDLKTYTDAAIGANATTNLNHIDTSAITDMSYLFDSKSSFNGKIGCWNTTKATTMEHMFSGATAFNQDISNWNTANVNNMNSMFSSATAFNRDISKWNVANVNNMNNMFSGAQVFNQDISTWNVANVTGMSSMFFYASNFNQDLSGWDVDKVTEYSDIFTGSPMEEKNKPAKFRTRFAVSFNLNGGMFSSPQTNLIVSPGGSISQATLDKIQVNYPDVGPKEGVTGVSREFVEWRVGGAKYNSSPITSNMTLGAVWSNSCGKIETVHPANRNDLKTYTDAAIGANATTNLNHIDTSAITDMSYLFNGKNSFNGDIACWNISKVSNMNNMFGYASAFNGDISNWNVSKVTDMSSMFQNATVFNKDISSWGVSNVTDMSSMFQYARAFDQDLSTWPVSNVTAHDDMFTGSAMATKTNQHPTFPSP